VLADDHATVRQGLRLLIDAEPDLEVVAEAHDGQSAVQRVEELEPDVLVLDISMPEMSGLTAARTLKTTKPRLPIVVLTRYGDDAYVQEMLRAGVAGYVLKQSASAELVQAIRSVAEGKQFLDSAVTMQVTDEFVSRARKRPGSTLTDRETEVLRLIARGYSNKEIALELDLSVKTVEVHKANSMRKLGLRGRVDIVRFAIVQGWMHEG
jgi:DNA-binding NarL/FixJ family response regulator